MSRRDSTTDPLLPTVNEPGTYAWAEEVVECINAAWRMRETSEQAFLVAVRAAIQHRVWELLSPPPPAEPYTTLANLIRRTAEPGQAENMQIVIKYSGLEDAANRASAAFEHRGDVSVPWTAEGPDDPELALGRHLLDQYASAADSPGAAAYNPSRPVGIPAGISMADVMAALSQAGEKAPRASAAQRKRERLEKTRPDLVEQVQARELTLKQAYVEAGIEKQVSAIDRLQKLWRGLSEDERDRFLSWLKQELQAEKVAAYREEVYGEDS